MKKILLLLTVCITLTACTYEPFDNKGNPDLMIGQDSELFEKLKEVLESESDLNYPCIKFTYPISVRLYDQEDNYLSQQTLLSDQAFIDFLTDLDSELKISVTFPIVSNYNDTPVVINTNEDLLMALSACEDDITIYFCNSNTETPPQCAWEISFSENFNNPFAGTVFRMAPGSNLMAYYRDEIYSGNWYYIHIEGVVHLNMFFNGDSDFENYWSQNYEVEGFYPSNFVVLFEDQPISFKRYCEDQTEYQVGDQGPTGGIVIYDKGFFSAGWRYLEMATQPISDLEWGCMSLNFTDTALNGLGLGIYNTISITYQHELLNNYANNPAVCNANNNGTVAAKNCLNLQSNLLPSWYLPSLSEMEIVYEYFQNNGGNSFENQMLWTSNQENETTAKAFDLENGATVNLPKNESINALPIRRF